MSAGTEDSRFYILDLGRLGPPGRFDPRHHKARESGFGCLGQESEQASADRDASWLGSALRLRIIE